MREHPPEVIRQVRTARTTLFPARVVHEVIDDQLAVLTKEVRKRFLASRQVGKGVPYSFNVTKKIGSENLSNQTYFVIGYRFVDQLMVGEFPDSVIVLAGCDTMSNGLLSQSLIDRGASVVVGWDKTLLSTQNDSVTLAFLEKVLVNGEEVTEAVSSVMTEYKHYLDPVSLKYYPMDAT